MKNMQRKIKVLTTTITAFLVLSLALVSMAAAAGAITLTPTTQAPGGSVTVDGTGFGATKKVGIGVGAEVTVTDERHNITDLVTTPDADGYYGPFGGTTNHYPIKPGSFAAFYDVDGVTSNYWDKTPPDGTLDTDSGYAIDPRVNYVNGSFNRKSTADWSTWLAPYVLVNYTYYTYNVTPAAGVTTNAGGTFSASITVPTVTDGNYVVTAVDTAGNKATQTLNVVPEGLTIGVMLALSTIAVIVSTRYFRKQPKIKSYN